MWYSLHESNSPKLLKKIGHIVRIAPNELAISDPAAIKIIYGTHAGFTKTDFYLPFRAPWSRYPDHFTNQDEKQHAERRRNVNSLYSMSNIIQMEESVDRCVEQPCQKFGEYADKEAVIDMADWAQWFAFDVVGELFFSRMFGFMKNAQDYKGYISALDSLIPSIAVALVMPSYLRPVFMASGAMMPAVRKALEALKFLEKVAEACVTERRYLLASKPDVEREDMLQRYFSIMRDKGKEKDFGLTEIKVDSYGSFIAGSDTTAATIAAILYYLFRNPAAYRTATADVDEAHKSRFLSPTIQYNEAVGFSYVVACIKEGMRLHPVVGMTMPRHVPRSGCEITGKWLAEGTRVGMNAAVVQRDERIFGSDPDDFVPERWLGKDPAKMERHMLHFGAGTRICIGKNISICGIYKVIPQLLRDFHNELAYPDEEWQTRNNRFNKPSGVHVKLRKRKEM